MEKRLETLEQVEKEIKRLEASGFVKLAKREAEVRVQRMEYLRELEALEVKGRKLYEQGVTICWLEGLCSNFDFYE